MDYRSLLEDAPRQAAEPLCEFYDGEYHSDVVTYLRDNAELLSAPRLQLALACAVFQDAYEIMVDAIIPASREALELMAQAEAAGLPSSEIAPYRREVESILADEIERDRVEADAAMAAIERGAETAEQVALLAYRASDQGELLESARLFLHAAELAASESVGRSQWSTPDPSMNYLVRAGVNLAKSGDYAQAYPYLRQAIDFDWKAGRLWADRHMVEWAYVEILREQACKENWDEFRSLWREAENRMKQLETCFLTIHPLQETLLTICVDNQIVDRLPAVVDAIESRETRLENAVAAKVAEARELLDR